MSLDAMKQALEALEGFIPYLPLPDKTQCGRYDKAITTLRAAIEQAEKQDWDGRHPKAQALIGAKARLEIKLRLVEQLVDDPSFEPTALDAEYWEPLHDKLNERLAQPRQWQGLTDEDLDIRALWDVLTGMKNADVSIVVQFAKAIEAKLKEKNR